LPGASPASPATQQRVDEETRRIIDEAEEEVTGLLERERGRLVALAEALLARETLDQADVYRLVGAEPPTLDPEEEAKAAAEP
jgi:cell division protease FtsH